MWLLLVKQNVYSVGVQLTFVAVQAQEKGEAAFGYMHTLHIGGKLAAFFISWALVLEQQHKFEEADEVYMAGLSVLRCCL